MLSIDNNAFGNAMAGSHILIVVDDGTATELGRILDGAGLASDRAATLAEGLERAGDEIYSADHPRPHAARRRRARHHP